MGIPRPSPDHIVLGLLREGESVAAAVLFNLGVSFDRVKQDIEDAMPAAGGELTAAPLWTDQAMRVLEQSMEESRRLNNSYVGCEHILLALLRDDSSLPAQAFARQEVSYDTARAEIQVLLGTERPKRPPRPSP